MKVQVSDIKWMASITIVVIFGALLFTMVGPQYGAQAANGDDIHVCVRDNPIGVMVNVSETVQCEPGWTRLTWNAQGQQGAPGDSQWQIDGSSTYYNNGNVGIGTTRPNEQLEITGNLGLPKSTATAGVIKSDGDRFIHNFGTGNFFAGVDAGNLAMSGVNNTGVGLNALQSNTTGVDNTATGTVALQSNTTGVNNTAAGAFALPSNTTGHSNTATGTVALQFNTTGDFNTANGAFALQSNTTGSNNTATGLHALQTNTTGGSNTVNGAFALDSNTTGSNNTALGHDADVSQGDLINATAIGANALVNASNKIRLGDDSVTEVEAKGDFSSISGDFIVGGMTLNVPDYVFEKGYPLMSLDELRAYIEREKHLPNIPSTEDIRKDGLGLSQFQMRLLEKVEELTLYTLEQQQQISDLQAQLDKQSAETNGVQAQLANITNSSSNNIVILAGGISAALVILVVSGWFVRRQQLQKS